MRTILTLADYVDTVRLLEGDLVPALPVRQALAELVSAVEIATRAAERQPGTPHHAGALLRLRHAADAARQSLGADAALERRAA